MSLVRFGTDVYILGWVCGGRGGWLVTEGGVTVVEAPVLPVPTPCRWSSALSPGTFVYSGLISTAGKALTLSALCLVFTK